MNSSEVLRNYRHDTVGKFKDISTAIEGFDENSFQDPEMTEVFHAIHEVLVKMVLSSKNTMKSKLSDRFQLEISHDNPNPNLPLLKLGEVAVRSQIDVKGIKYIYFVAENKGDLNSDLIVMKAMLPI
jgi:hypothetical protein